jgi:hypothetical protein
MELIKEDRPSLHSDRYEPDEVLLLDSSESLQRFVGAAAQVGIGAEDAVRMGVERGLVLSDLCEVGVDIDLGRRRLRAAAMRARPCHELTADLAQWVRRLSMARPIPVPSIDEGLAVHLPDGLLVRAAAGLGARHLRAEAVPEMVAWELAAALGARTMGEWALRELLLGPARG